MTSITSTNPFTGETVAEVPVSSPDEVRLAVQVARDAARDWGQTSVSDRAKYIHQVCDGLLAARDRLAMLATQEMGMPISAATFNVERAVGFFEWYANNAEDALAPQVSYEDENETHTLYRVPRGVHAVIFPWNFPFSNIAWAIGQSLMCGNTVVLKMSELIPATSGAVADIMNAALPKGVFNLVQGDGEVGQVLLEQPVDFISFTGSTATGRKVYAAASAQLTPVVMELGGSAPGIVCEHVDLDGAATAIATARLGNSGQRCDGLKRLIVHESVFDQTIDALRKAFETFVIGDPLDQVTTVGPLASKKQQLLAAEQLRDATTGGATFAVGELPDTDGTSAMVVPSILTNVNTGMRIWREEVFAPVLPIMAYDTTEAAIKLANDTEYGLGGHIYCSDETHAVQLTNALETGMVSVNGAIYTRPWNPFGGIKCSGFGREHGVEGFRELTVPKIVARRK